MSYTRYEWCNDLAYLLNPNPRPEIIEFLLGWTFVETSAGQGAQYNLLNTTEHATGSTDFNADHVQNFTSYSQGIDTNAFLIKNSPLYNALYTAIKNNDIKALGYLGATMAADVNGDLQVWVSGSPDGDRNYPVSVRSASNKGANDVFPGMKYTHEQLISMAKSDCSDAVSQLQKLQSLILQL